MVSSLLVLACTVVGHGATLLSILKDFMKHNLIGSWRPFYNGAY